MRSFFWRIFLWFWLAMLLLSSAVTRPRCDLTDPEQFFPSWRAIPMQRMDQLARQSIEAFEQGGTPAVRALLTGRHPAFFTERELTDSTIRAAYLFDANNLREVDGQRAARRHPEPGRPHARHGGRADSSVC